VPCIQHCNKYEMTKECCSANRCSRIECPKCARRYARRIARDFCRPDTGRIYAIAISAGVADLDEFRQWRLSIWNIITYRRQICRWWQGVSIRVWLRNDGSIRGVVAPGSISEDELIAALGCRWPTTLRWIEFDALFNELYEAVQPDNIMSADPDHARYQRRQLTVRPFKFRKPARRSKSVFTPSPYDEPMPVLI